MDVDSDSDYTPRGLQYLLDAQREANVVDFDAIDASLRPAPRDTVILITSQMCLESVIFREHPRGGKIIQHGDIIRGTASLDDGGEISLDILLRGQADVVRPRTKSGTRQRKGFEISIGNVIFPNDQYNKTIESASEFAACLRLIDPRFCMMKSSMKSLVLFRNGELLGSLYDIKQATAFAEKEGDFDYQQRFEKNRTRKLSREQNNDGFEIASHSGLYRKIKKAEYHLFNKGAMIDLGQILNNALSQLSDDQHMIIMYDFRMATTDGIPGPDGATMDDIFSLGPDAFGTHYTRELAASGGVKDTWSKGHSFIGPIGLISGLQDPHGVKMTEFERKEVINFHETYVKGKIMHYPLPINRAGVLRCGNSSSTYRFDLIIDDWVLDPSGPSIAAGGGLGQASHNQPQPTPNLPKINVRKVAQNLTRNPQVPVTVPMAPSAAPPSPTVLQAAATPFNAAGLQKQKKRPAPMDDADDEDDNYYFETDLSARGRFKRTDYSQIRH